MNIESFIAKGPKEKESGKKIMKIDAKLFWNQKDRK